jgi:hypothetical protein
VKVLLVLMLLAGTLTSLLIVLDLILGYPISGIFQKEMMPFRVMEQTEITILGLFGVYFVGKGIVRFIKKRQKKLVGQNQGK